MRRQIGSRIGPGPPRRSLSAARRYQLLLDLARRISGTLDLDEILDHLLDAARCLVPYDAAGIFVLNHDVWTPAIDSRAKIAGVARRGFPTRPGDTDAMLLEGRGIVGHVITTGEGVVVPDVRVDPRYVEGRPGILSEVTVPIVINGRPVGALDLESEGVSAFDAADAEALDFLATAAAISIEKAMLHRHLVEKRHLEEQLRLARQVQARLLPTAPPRLPGYDIAGASISSAEIGGDYYDFLPLGEGRFGMVIADVSGKGIPAALIMATFRALVRTHLASGLEPGEAMGAVNRSLIESTGRGAFVTAVCGVLESSSGRFQYSSCGHLPPVLLRAGGQTEELGTCGPLLGVFADARHLTLEATLAPGDTLLLYTDGVSESLAPDGAELDVERLGAIARGQLEATAAELVEKVTAAARQSAGSQLLADDFTLVVLRRL